MSGYFVPGWHPEYAMAAKEEMDKIGGYVTADYGDTSALPEAMSLSAYLHWSYDQGPVGSCFAVAAAQAFQVLTSADNSDGYAKWDLFPLSRAFVWYEGRRRDGLLGSRMDGGSVTNAMLAMKEPGVPRESTWPYKPNHSFLERKPAEDAYTEAKENRVTAVASVPIDQWKRSIKNLNPITIGIWWPYGWDNQINTSGQAVTIGQGTFGHALVVIGYIEDWNGKLWWQIENSHGAIYHPIPPDIQKRVPGYIGYSANDPSRVFSFWVRDDMLREVLGYGNQETIVAAGLSGFRAKPLPWSKVL